MILAQQTKYFEDAKVDFSKKTDKFESYFEKLKNTKVVLEHQLDRKIQDSNVEKDQFLKQIASLESNLASQDLISNQKDYSDLRTSYNALKAKFDSLNRDKGKSLISNFSTPKVSVSKKIYMGESSNSFQKKILPEHSEWCSLALHNDEWKSIQCQHQTALRYQDYQDKDCQGRLLDGFQDDIKYEHVGLKTQDRKKAKLYKDDQVMMKDLKGKVKTQRQRQRQ
ncbi:hypothetical protein Tco_0920218 [Tanacetum coccineum]